jgi:hypothetical protein
MVLETVGEGRCIFLLPNYKGKRHFARTTNMCDKLPKAVHIFFGSAMGPLDLALGTVATRAGGV